MIRPPDPRVVRARLAQAQHDLAGVNALLPPETARVLAHLLWDDVPALLDGLTPTPPVAGDAEWTAYKARWAGRGGKPRRRGSS